MAFQSTVSEVLGWGTGVLSQQTADITAQTTDFTASSVRLGCGTDLCSSNKRMKDNVKAILKQ